MKQDLREALDESLTLLAASQTTLEECLDRYPEHAADLRPLLEVALDVRRVPSLASSPAAFDAGKQRMLQALAEKEERRQAASPSLLHRYRGWVIALFRERERPTTGQRRAFRLAMATALALVLLAIGGLSFLSWLGGDVAQAVVLAQMSGVVEVMPAGNDTWRPMSIGDQVEAGDRVRTGLLSAATLAFFDGSVTDLDAETEVTVAQTRSRRDGGGKAIVLRQWLGRTYSRVEQLPDPSSRFEIETPAAAIAVRGTVFVVEVASDGITRVAVEEGLVEVTAQETAVELQSGQATTVHPGLSPAPTILTPTLAPPSLPSPTSMTGPTETPKPTTMEEPEELTGTPEPTIAEEPTETPDGEDDEDDGDETPDGDDDGDDGDETPDGDDDGDDGDDAPDGDDDGDDAPDRDDDGDETPDGDGDDDGTDDRGDDG